MATFGVLTGGGDCPGLNAEIRAVIRRGLAGGHSLIGFHGGWRGLRDDDGEQLDLANTAGLVTGGDGTLGAARGLCRAGVPLVAIPKTIDSDVGGTDFSVGFHTAVQVTTDAIDRLHTTAESHNRVMVGEVMGRHAGWIATAAACRRRR